MIAMQPLINAFESDDLTTKMVHQRICHPSFFLLVWGQMDEMSVVGSIPTVG